MLKRLLIFFLLSLVFSSCKTTNLFIDKRAGNAEKDLDFVFFNDKHEYRIRKDDKITIGVWGQDDLGVGSTYGIYNSNEVYGKWLMVDPKGNIEVPKIGTYQVENKSITELKDLLKVEFSVWVKNPIVDVKVLNREITVLGEVRDPQIINIDKEKNTLLEVIAVCKGFDSYADARKIKVLRQVGPDVKVANLDLTKAGDFSKKNIYLKAGDVVIVPSKKHKDFDRRISTIIPFTTTMTAAAILMGTF